MDKKKLVLLVVALLVAAGTAFVARSMFAGASAPQADAAPAAPTGPKVLVAQRALPVGTIITADAISFQDWPSELVKDAYFIDGEADMSKLLGTVVRFPLTAGQPVTQGSLVAPGDRGFLAAALGPGMRAVTIPVSAKTGVGGFVFPGDRVDLVLTQQVKGEGDPLRTSETILRNLRVLATDQTTDNEVVDGKTVVKAFRTVTIEVTPRIAEKVAVAQEIGTLSLSLRSIADSQGEFERILANGEVNVPEGATKEQENKLVRQAMERPIEGNTTYVTGGDVSRFQRSSRPMTADERATRSNAMAVAFSNRGPVSDAAPVRTGPVVRVTRGKTTTEEVVGAK
ncbi:MULTISPECIES: Flp pilus assembly protein CpaB [Novosphingobium]|uniref:Pilus assembly protein CpaB n=1 Tax=Novosphingobium mathurense TaxID=428990 RepID=A0A1U6GT60_9SPHN|nr:MULTISPECIES: Flp pilus assembly protein CpaB [Novosphingobium]CDO37522.1 Pilus assembly protein CpaB [Novosphingobium sp. KN65.2]SLJ86688.1 pilus assembly protein CpaB [Novosphingobium mathurense]